MPTTTENALVYLSSAQVEELCRELDPLDVVTGAFAAVRQGSAGIAPEAALRWQAPDGTAARSLVLPARYGDTRGCKIINACIGNPTRGLPRASGLIVLFDPATAQPVCILEGGRISALRTAAVSLAALCALRAPSSVRRIAFLGCGRQASTHLELLAVITQPIVVSVYDTRRERAQFFATEVRSRMPGSTVIVADDPENAVRDADAVIAATTTTTPYIELDWMAAESILLNVSLDDATERLLLGCDQLLVDDWGLVSEDDTRLLGRLAQAGLVVGPGETAPDGGRTVQTDLATLLSAGPAATQPWEGRIVVNPFGMGVHDVAFAARVYQAALDSNRGILLPC